MLVSQTNPGELNFFLFLFLVAIILHFYWLSERKRCIASTEVLKYHMTLTRIKKTTTTKKYIQAKTEVCHGSSNGTLSVGFKNIIHKAHLAQISSQL